MTRRGHPTGTHTRRRGGRGTRTDDVVVVGGGGSGGERQGGVVLSGVDERGSAHVVGQLHVCLYVCYGVGEGGEMEGLNWGVRVGAVWWVVVVVVLAVGVEVAVVTIGVTGGQAHSERHPMGRRSREERWGQLRVQWEVVA